MGAAYLLCPGRGLGHATRLLMLGEPVRAPEAERIGLISELADEGDADEAAQRLARRLAEGPALAYAQTKALLTAELDMPLAASVELDASTQALLMTGEDYAEFHAAFTEKRAPKSGGGDSRGDADARVCACRRHRRRSRRAVRRRAAQAPQPGP